MNEKGNLAASIVLSVIAVLSGVILIALVMGDRVSLENNEDSMQSAHFLRTSLNRCSAIMSYIDDFSEAGGVFERKIITDRSKNKIYTLRSEITPINDSEDQSMFNLSSYVESNNGRITRYQDINPSAKYAEQIYAVESLADFLLFYDRNISVNDDEVRNWGADEIWFGRIHSNTSFRIGTHVLDGYSFPYYGGLVTCSSNFTFPYNYTGDLNDTSIFGGGARENIPVKVLPERAEKIRDNSIWIDNGQEITYIEVNDHNYIMCTAQITELPPEAFVVYNSFPPYNLIGDSLFTNYIVFKDTVWTTPVNRSINDESVFVNSDLWIHGNFGGKQTWGCSGDMFLVGDITLENTVVGEAPDGYRESENDFNGNVNTSDYVGLVSEGKIIIKYAYKNPVDGLIHWDNCGDHVVEESGIYIYAALAALGKGDGWEDGYFSYEYHYPHPSTPHAYNWINTEEDFMYPDLHLGKYPPDNSQHRWPWPANSSQGFAYPGRYNPGNGTGYVDWAAAGAPDYPWYNPVYPSAKVFYERGNIHLFGSLAQRRHGFVHRSGNDIDNGLWDLDDPTSPMMGPSTEPSGYGKRYQYDNRFLTNPPINYPEVRSKAGDRIFNKYGVKHKPVPETI